MSKTAVTTAARAALSVAAWLILMAFLFNAVDGLPSAKEWEAFVDFRALLAMTGFATVFTLVTALRSLRFGNLLRRTLAIGWQQIMTAFPWLFMIGAITPFRAGESVRIVWVRRFGGSSAETLGYWLIERYTDLAALTICLTIGLAMAPGQPSTMTSGAVVAVVVIVVGYLGIWALGPSLTSLSRRLPRALRWVSALLQSFSYMRQARIHLLVVGMTIAIWLAMAGAFWLVLSVLEHGQAPFGVALACVGAVNLAGVVSGAPGNLGSFQAAMVGVMSLYGYEPDHSFMAAVLIHATGLIVTLALGFIAKVAERFPSISTDR